MKLAGIIRSSHRSTWTFLLLAFLLAAVFVAIPSFAQEAGAAAGAPPVPEVAQAKTLWGVIRQGGWIMVPLALISLWCLSLIIECFVRIRLPNFAPVEAVRQLKAAFAEENYQQAWRVCKARSTFLTNIMRHGLERIGRGRAACESAIVENSLKEGMIYRTKVSYLSSIGVVSPMVGLLGTVTGMIKAFQTLGSGGIGDPSKLAAAIGEVLVATATGLMVAIPAFFLYYFFRNRLQQVMVLAEDVINQLMVDVKYEELQGIKIGEDLEAELTAGGAPAANGEASVLGEAAGVEDLSKRVSQAINGVTVACPQCNAPITAGTPKCGKCGTELQWS